MAHLSIISAFLYVCFAVALLSSSVVTALDTELAPSPSPSPLIETGAGNRTVRISLKNVPWTVSEIVSGRMILVHVERSLHVDQLSKRSWLDGGVRDDL
ncbi:hypothetical protein GOBAR_AA15048 [Gossypium barbadense]|uniref:Plastocyanin-like domain-containing protein n=1 Tax=Gossypium barbadense TaxID=3634 RepID=A0A2P5XQG8_GOSBA|nr:hypothetical protein GOBAR_AA15048 [Gossypium barbadense]